MKKFFSICSFLSFILLSFFPSLVMAKTVNSFLKMDIDNDGKVTAEEFKTFFPNMHNNAFLTIDTNSNNVLEANEWEKFLELHSMGMKQKDATNSTAQPQSVPQLITPPKQK